MKKTLTLLALLGCTATANLLSAGEVEYWTKGVSVDPQTGRIVGGYTSYKHNPYSGYVSPSSGEVPDHQMCWAASASNIVAWWQDRVSESGALILPENVPTGYEVWETVRRMWNNDITNSSVLAAQHWLSGDAFYQDEQLQVRQTELGLKHEGFFPRLEGTHHDFHELERADNSMTTCVYAFSSTDPDQYALAVSKKVVEMLKEGWGFTFQSTQHAVTLFGVAVDEETQLITKIYFSDNNDGFVRDKGAYKVMDISSSTADGSHLYDRTYGFGYLNQFGAIRTTGIQFTDYDVRINSEVQEDVFSHYCNLVVGDGVSFDLKYDLRDANKEGSPIDPTLTTYNEDGSVKSTEKVSTGNICLMDGTVTLVDATGDTAKFDKGGSVEGVFSFEHSDKAGAEAVRKLSVKRDGAAVGELTVKTTEGTNTLDVAEDKKLTIGKLTGEGNLDKTGKGAAEVTDAVTLKGEIRVHEGSFIFGKDVELTGNTKLTVSEGARVQGAEGKAITLTIDSGVHVNDGVMTLTTTVNEGATLKGSGTFAGVTMNGGKLIVGNSPGQQTYTDDLAVNLGDIVFSVDGWNAADEDSAGWGNGVYSNINMVGDANALTLGADSNIRIALGNTALDELTSGQEGSFSMDLVTGIDNVEFFSSDLLNQLAKQTLFFASDELGALPENLDSGSDLNSYLRDMEYSMNNGVLTLKGSYGAVSPVPEPTTGTLSLLALAGLCARRRRK